ncbi:hypothetical protein QCA50_015809 [Cerrena zonata]|uniref:Uncharacterized protein n=1 Tax=Cerrena zonata TaxID=2478898 RepID=A0AAW0FJE3_9APHY
MAGHIARYIRHAPVAHPHVDAKIKWASKFLGATIFKRNEESQDDSELIKNLSKDKINVRKRANTSYNYERPSPITIFPHSSFTSPRSPQTPTSIQTPLTKTPSLKSFTISPLVRTNKDLNEKEDDNAHVSPQSAISVNSPILSSSGRKKSNTSLNHIFTSNSNSHKSLENTINTWPKVEEVDSIADSGADRQLQSIPLEDLELLPAPPPRKQSLPGSPVLQPPAKTTKTPELPGTPSKTGSRRSSVSASSQAARIAFQSSRSPSTDHHQSSRRPSLGQISTLQRRFSSGSPSPGSGGSPLLRKTRSTNEVANFIKNFINKIPVFNKQQFSIAGATETTQETKPATQVFLDFYLRFG